ncbi:MAG: hypothetical protein WB808_04775 [Candidatus Dormiibacterota bacterium]
MVEELGRRGLLPLLPAGTAIFEGLPLGALVLVALAPAVGDGLITMRDDAGEGVLVIRDGVISETIWITDGVRADGNEALELVHAAHAATVSACRLSHDVMGLIRPLIRSQSCYADLRLEWIVWPNLLRDLETRGGTFVVELSTPSDRGVTVIEQGRRVATFLESHPALGDPDLLDGLASGGVGSIRVLGQGGEGVRELAEPLVAASTVNQPRRDFVVVQSPAPAITDADGTNATLSAFFGPSHNASDQNPELRIDGIGQQRPTPVESVLPQLKTLVRDRLQRSSGSVEEVVDGAARDRQSLEWLADRVRVMSVRGFLHSTFDQLADDMLALTPREPV